MTTPIRTHISLWAVIFASMLAAITSHAGAQTPTTKPATNPKANPLKALRVETLATDINAGTGGIAVDKAGNVYTADFGTQLGPAGKPGTKIFKIIPDGEVSLFCSGLDGASGNAFGADGTLFQSNIRGNLISRITPDGEVSVFANEGLRNPVGIIIDASGTLFVGNCGSGTIQKITRDGVSTEFAKSPLLKCPNGITMDDAGNLYIANFYNGDVIKVTPEAEVSRLATIPGNNNGHLTYHRGQLIVVSRGAHQIYTVTPDGEVTLLAGSGVRGKDDGSPLDATFSLPNDIVASPDGKFLYVNETAPIEGSPMILTPTRVRRIVLAD